MDSLPTLHQVLSITSLRDPPSLSPSALPGSSVHTSHLAPKSSDTFGVGMSFQATRDAVTQPGLQTLLLEA